MRTALLVLALTLTLAAITHLAVVFGVPRNVERDWLDAHAEAGEPGFAPLALADENLEARYCAFDLAEAPRLVEVTLGTDYWSVSLHDRFGRASRVLNERAARDDKLTLLVATARQERRLENPVPDAVRITPGVSRGIVVVRALVDRESLRARTLEQLDAASCRPLSVKAAPSVQVLGGAGTR